MKWHLGAIFILIITIILLTSCNHVPVRVGRVIPSEIVFQNETYEVIPKPVSNIGKEIGITNEYNFDVYKINNSNIKDAIAILVRDSNPTVYYKATKK